MNREIEERVGQRLAGTERIERKHAHEQTDEDPNNPRSPESQPPSRRSHMRPPSGPACARRPIGSFAGHVAVHLAGHELPQGFCEESLAGG